VILSVVGARPNFMKLAPLARALAARPGVRHRIVHTGQHYDGEMSDVFFQELGLPRPDYHLDVGSASHAQQTAAIMTRFEPICLETTPELVLFISMKRLPTILAITLAMIVLPVPALPQRIIFGALSCSIKPRGRLILLRLGASNLYAKNLNLAIVGLQLYT